MQCPRCSTLIRDGVRFCEDCGARVNLNCPSCGAELAAGKKFCGACGTRVDALLGERPPSPQPHTPPHLAEKILTSRSALEGERKQVTVLFADLKGSMELLADRDPEDARKLLDPVLDRMMEAVHRYEGTVNQVMGDGIMALFGAPLAHEDHAVRACYAALAMQAAIRRYTEEVRRAHGLEVQIRVGLNSGEVVVRAIGNDLRMDYSAIGQTTHLAARMEQLAPPGTIRLSAESLRLAEGFVQVRRLGPVPVRGLAEPVEVFELLGAGPSRTRWQVAAARGLTPFVGRQAELQALCRTLERAQAGAGQVLAVVGEPGVGKSRLFWEFTRSHRTAGWLVIESGGVSYGKVTPYLPVVDLLKAHFQIEARDDARTIREKLTGKLLTLDATLEPTLPALLALLDVPAEDPEWETLDPRQRRRRILDAVKRSLLRESQVQPVCLVFEDLHWIDTETQALLDSLIESLPTARLLLLVNYRPEYQHGWGSKTHYTQLRIDPLPPESAEALLETILGNEPGLEALKRLLIERTEGNPFFLEESVRALVETQALAGARGAYRLVRPLASTQVPATVQAVLAARVDRLAPEDKRLLQSAAVIGKDVPFVLLQAIAELPEEAFRRGLARLQAAEFLYETGLFPELEYTFKHTITNEVTYGSLLQDRRRALHARIVAAVERLFADRVTEQVDRLAQHALRGEVWDKAVTYLRQAGAKAAGRSAHREAVAYFEQALEALQHLPESRRTVEQAIDLRFDLRNSLWPLGDHRRIFEYLGEAEALAEALDDQRRLGALSSFMTQHFRLMGDPDRAIESGRRALAIAEALGDFGLQVVTNFRLGRAYDSLGDFRRAADFFRRNVTALAGEQLHQRFGQPGLASVLSRAWLVLCLAELGEFVEGTAHGKEAVRIAETADHAYSLASAYCGLGGLYLRKGDLAQAVRPLEIGLELCRTRDFPVLFPVTASQLGYAYALSGRVAEGIPLLEQVAERAAATEPTAYHALILVWLSEAYLLAGRLDDAMEVARRALDPAGDRKERGDQAWALRLHGEIASRRAPPDEARAEEAYRQGIALAGALGLRPLQAHCRLGLGEVHRRRGRLEPARAELAAAIGLFRALEMTFWLPRAGAALAAAG